MWKKLAGLISVSSITYCATFATTSLLFVAGLVGGLPAVGTSGWWQMAGAIGITAGVGLLATTSISLMRTKQIAQTTVGRWLGAVGISGALHAGLIFGIVATGTTIAGLPAVFALLVLPPVASSAILIRRGKYGLLGGSAAGELANPDS